MRWCRSPGQLPPARRGAETAGIGFQRAAGAAQGNYDLASLSTSTLNDPHDGVRDFISRESETGYHNPQVDALIARANATLDIAQRKPLYHQLYQALADDPPVILLGNREILSASARHRL